MAITEVFLKRLIKFGVEKELFVELPIKDIDRSCCTKSVTTIIDFDLTKKKMTAIQQSNLPKSCDGLKILPTKGRIDFIEFKGWQEFKKWSIKEDTDVEMTVQSKVDKFDFVSKIEDSLYTLKGVTLMKEFELTTAERKIYRELPKNFIIVVDIEKRSSIEEFALTLEVLATTSDIDSIIERRIEQTINDIKVSELMNLQKPILKRCSDMDDFY